MTPWDADSQAPDRRPHRGRGLAAVLFVAQGGFGGGHGPFDLMIFVLGVPWTLILLLLPWTEALWVSDYVMLVLVPLGLNLLFAAVLGVVLARRK